MLTIKNILCPVDRSPISRHALDYAIAVAAAYQSKLRVIEVIDLSLPPLPAGVQPALPAFEEMRQACLDELHAFLPSPDSGAVRLDVAIVEGPVVAGVLGEAERMRADLIVMGTHGRGGFEHLVLGSVTEKILRKATCPVLTVPPGLSRLRGGLSPFPSIVCAFDFSRTSAHALLYAWSLAQDTDGRLTVIHVVEWPFGEMAVGDVPKEIDALREGFELDARQQLHDALPPGALASGRLEEVVTCGKPSRSILRLAGDRAAALIVIGVHGRGAVSLAMFGSTTHRVIREARCPVLTVRSSE